MSLMVALLLMPFAADAEAPVEPGAYYAANDELAGYLREAARDNPALHQRYAQWQAALERVPQAASLDDPMFTYGQFLQSDISRFRVAVSQKLPWFGTLEARSDRAAAEAEAAFARLVAERNRVYAEVKRAYFDYAWLRDRIEVTRSQLEIYGYMADVVEARMALALAGDDEVLRVSMARAEARDRLRQLEDMRDVFSAELLEALGRDSDDLIPWPREAAFAPEPPPVEALVARARTANPGLAELAHLAESREEAVELARKKGYPDVTVGLEYVSISKPRQIRPDRPYPASLNAGNRVLNTLAGETPFSARNAAIDAYTLAFSDEPMSYSDGGEDNIMLSLTVNLPIWRGKVRAGIGEARQLAKSVDHERRRLELDLGAAVRRARFELEDAARRQTLYADTLVPQAERTYESLQSRYAAAVSGADFLDVMESVQRILAFELERVRAIRDRHIAEAELEVLVAGPWPEHESMETEGDD